VAILIVLAAGTLGLTGGLAIYAFVRGYGIPYLGMPRTRQAAAATERGQPVAGPALLATACVAFAVGAPVLLIGFSRAVRAATGVVSVSVQRASDDPAGRSGPVHHETAVTPVFERYLYRPVLRAVEWLADFVRPLQSGDVNLYLLYVFVAVLVAYLIAAV
jgi:hypothetical protein